MPDVPYTRARDDAQQIVAEVVWSRGFDRDHQMVTRAQQLAFSVVAALRREGLLIGSSQANTREILEKYGTMHAEPPARGISHLVAEALVLLGLPVVHRDVLRSLMPELETRAAKNTVGMQFNRALRKFNGWKWIERSDEGIVTVLDPDALLGWFTAAQDANAARAATTLDLATAVAALKVSLAADDHDELRRQELIALQRLMQTAPGAVTGERGHVHVLPRSDVL